MPVYGCRFGGLLEAHCGAWVLARGQGDFHFLTIHPPHERNTIGAVGGQPFSQKCRGGENQSWISTANKNNSSSKMIVRGLVRGIFDDDLFCVWGCAKCFSMIDFRAWAYFWLDG